MILPCVAPSQSSSLEGEKKQLVTLCVSEETLGCLHFPQANSELSTDKNCSAGKWLFETEETEAKKYIKIYSTLLEHSSHKLCQPVSASSV